MNISDIDYDWINRRYQYAATAYGNWQVLCDEVEKVYKGDFDTEPDVEGADIEIIQPSEGARILNKFLQMLSIRADIRFIVPRRTDTAKETAKADKVERILKGLFEQMETRSQRNVIRLGTHITLLRGRGVWHVRYNPHAEGMGKIEVRTYDSYAVYPVFGPDGVRYFVREYYMTPLEVEMFFEGITDEKVLEKKADVLGEQDKDGNYKVTDIRVLEYWDKDYFAWTIGNEVIDVQEHGYGFCPYAEARFNDSILDDMEWQARGVLFDVYREIKNKAILKSKLATGVSKYFYPLMYVKSGDTLTQMDHFAPPGTVTEVGDDFQMQVLNPTPNMDVAMLLKNELDEGIYNGTISKVAFVQDVPDVSGFLMSSILNVLQDQISDYRYSIELATAAIAGQLLRIIEEFADEQPDGAFEVLTEKGVEKITADDIDGFYTVKVKIKVELPQDKLQMATIFNQLYQMDAATGLPRFDFDTALRISGLEDVIGDVTAMKKRREMEFLLNNDPQSQQLRLEAIRAENFPELKDMQKEVKKMQSRQERDALREEERAIDKGMSDSVILPAEIANDPEMMEQFTAMIKQGIPAAQAIKTLSEGKLPLGAPGQSPMGGGDEAAIMELLGALTGGGGQGGISPPPDGMTGYGGIAPAALPPAMQGALPRQSVDQDNLMLEQAATDMRRGGLPPAR